MKPQIVAELVNYKSRMVPFMPGRQTADKERAFFAIFSTMIGAVAIARLLPDRTMREKVWRAQEISSCAASNLRNTGSRVDQSVDRGEIDWAQ